MTMNTHLVPQEHKWALKKEGSKKVSKIFERKVDALKYAITELKSDSCIYVHGKDGKIKDVKCIY